MVVFVLPCHFPCIPLYFPCYPCYPTRAVDQPPRCRCKALVGETTPRWGWAPSHFAVKHAKASIDHTHATYHVFSVFLCRVCVYYGSPGGELERTRVTRGGCGVLVYMYGRFRPDRLQRVGLSATLRSRLQHSTAHIVHNVSP